MLIYKILRADEWAALKRDGETQGAPVDVADGFIHFSTWLSKKSGCCLAVKLMVFTSD